MHCKAFIAVTIIAVVASFGGISILHAPSDADKREIWRKYSGKTPDGEPAVVAQKVGSGLPLIAIPVSKLEPGKTVSGAGD